MLSKAFWNILVGCNGHVVPTLIWNSSFRYWNEPRCARKYAGIEKYHPKFCLDVHDFSPLFAPPPPPPLPPPPPGDLAQGGFGDQAIALAVTPEKKKTQLNVNADKINAKFTIGHYSIIFKFSFYTSGFLCKFVLKTDELSDFVLTFAIQPKRDF